MTTDTLPSQNSFLSKKLFAGITPAMLIVIAIMIFSFAIHIYNIDAIGNANEYYTAAVESMLKSWSNFFFVAAEPGGSVTVDKPPLGLWIQTIFAYFLGVSGFTVTLPNILAGVFGIPLLYVMVKKYMGELAGIIAGFVMAITPVFIATNRNNTMDGMLVFTLLLAAFAFIQATETGKKRWLFLGAFIVGLGFNIKMLQAFLPLPAFYALYFFASKETWLRKIINLSLATVLLIAVSLSWAIAVDLTPAENRPYIGSSDNNTVFGLIFGHNGISRLDSQRDNNTPRLDELDASQNGPQTGSAPDAYPMPEGRTPPQQALTACENQSQGSSCSFTMPNGREINGSCITVPNSTELACAPQGMIPQNQSMNQQPPNNGNNGTPFSNETGSPGALRFFTQPLSKQMSWLLPFALISVLLALFGSKIKLPVESNIHKALILWAGWLLTCVVFFSMISGIFHAYYAIMLAPALGAMVGIGFAHLWNQNKTWAFVALVISAIITIAFQIFATTQYNEFSRWMFGTLILLGCGTTLIFIQKRLAYIMVLASMLIIPLYWSMMTVGNSSNNNLPTAYEGQRGGDRARANQPPADNNNRENVNAELVQFLQANTQDVEYLVAVPSSQQGANLVIETGRPVLYIGGFGGGDEVVSVDDLQTIVANGELRYVLYGGDRGKQNITNWLNSSCTVVNGFDVMTNNPRGDESQSMKLYECK
ncbi:MAG: glycosyl transferase family protein [Chloroflexi bacterium OLB14]|nr:MAG: glycosyl transferase family protein [Chloroflexi bacterium OLB14]